MCACSVVSDCVQPNGLYLPGSFVHGIFQARILEFIAIFYLGDLPDSEFKPRYLASPALTGRFFFYHQCLLRMSETVNKG